MVKGDVGASELKGVCKGEIMGKWEDEGRRVILLNYLTSLLIYKTGMIVSVSQNCYKD